ncbi:putative ornithine aminotransferase [Neospora caninum Liverpool]|uniref:Ornithine aminotransferase n=1 Tax=Neospora caninum (strain Liverpool) TaxID=572307 RepID=F0VJN5_NEOCL|nr:putative ornithine aminotransferase [Neospora caninum Liverpool]CBZ53946.1 putative ornithine aminotransferase [Neospora caninum Liverpool]CEL67945.1 TPA: ornithine aminotransferase, putative [Neospora caninum Liverpool]|eukprot:XP_003883978.1 putative ornithine aminotransferase [Neospora caninum Liverpool]
MSTDCDSTALAAAQYGDEKMSICIYRDSLKLKTEEDFFACDRQYVCGNYAPVPVVISKGKGARVWDINGKEYYDFLAGVSSLSQGHCHPRVTAALCRQAEQLTLTLRSFGNDVTGPACRFMAEMFGYDRVLLMNTGAEAGESAIKIARKWAYEVKGVPQESAKIILCNNNYWGRTITACSSSTTFDCYNNFGPFTPGFELINYDDIDALEGALKDPNVAAFFVEPIQGEGGVNVPKKGYLKRAHELCKSKDVLLIVDEIQTGLCRTGRLLAADHDEVHPDILLLGKSLSAGVVPISAVMGRADVMDVLKPGTHGSTFGGNPLACAVAVEALTVLKDEKLADRAERLGNEFRDCLTKQLDGKVPWIKEIRGRGLLNAVEVDSDIIDPNDVVTKLKENGILTKPTRVKVLRFIPPLVITDEEHRDATARIIETLLAVEEQRKK